MELFSKSSICLCSTGVPCLVLFLVSQYPNSRCSFELSTESHVKTFQKVGWFSFWLFTHILLDLGRTKKLQFGQLADDQFCLDFNTYDKKTLFFGHPVLMSLSDPPMLLVSHSREPDILWHTKPYRSCQAQSQSTQLCPFHDYGIKKQPDITMGDFWVFCFNQLQCLLRPRDFRWFKILRRTFPGQLSGQSLVASILFCKF